MNKSDPEQWEKRIREILSDRERLLHEMVINQDKSTAELMFDWDEAIVQRILAVEH